MDTNTLINYINKWHTKHSPLSDSRRKTRDSTPEVTGRRSLGALDIRSSSSHSLLKINFSHRSFEHPSIIRADHHIHTPCKIRGKILCAKLAREKVGQTWVYNDKKKILLRQLWDKHPIKSNE